MVSCGRAVWSRIHCFSFGVTRISDRNDFKEGRVTGLVMSEDCTWWSCPVHRARGENRFQRPVTVDILPQSRPYLRKFPQPPNPALPAGNKLVTGISDSKQSILVTSALKTHDKISLTLVGLDLTVWSTVASSSWTTLPEYKDCMPPHPAYD